jgi:tetratricopeptide (TPR) repeat protein
MAGMLDHLAGRKGNPAMALELIEHAITRLDAVVYDFEDPQYDAGEILDQLGESHIIAAKGARPDPIPFAGRLFKLQLEGNWNTFDSAYESYATVLGKEGRRHYKELATEAWYRAVPTRRRSWDRSHGEPRIETIMKDIARVDGDREMLAEIRASQFTTLREFEELAGEFKNRGQHKQAVEWAERGLNAFSKYSAEGLRRMLIEEYPRIGRYDDMMRVALEFFSRSPGVGTYGYLKGRTESSGVWEKLREKLLTLARAGAAPIPHHGLDTRKAFKDSSLAVEILLGEGDAESAWQEAIDGDCRDALWIRLADVRATSAPEDAVAAYRSLVDKWIAAGMHYEEAVDLIGRMRQVMNGIGQGGDFAEYLAEMRSTQKRKKKLMELLGEIMA